MKFKDLHPPILELAPGQTFHRVQLTRARKTSVRINGFLLPPVGLLADRFDLPAESTAYLADSAHTALYESRFRREVKSRSLSELIHLSVVQFVTRGTLRLADLRSLAEAYPVLQAQRFNITQAFALVCRQHKLDGILYESAQHPHHTCVVLFEAGIAKMKKIASESLVTPDTHKLRSYVTDAARRSAVPLLDFPDQDT
jgi:hypothetical protein